MIHALRITFLGRVQGKLRRARRVDVAPIHAEQRFVRAFVRVVKHAQRSRVRGVVDPTDFGARHALVADLVEEGLQVTSRAAAEDCGFLVGGVGWWYDQGCWQPGCPVQEAAPRRCSMADCLCSG